MTQPEEDVVTKLDSAVAALTKNTNLSVGAMPAKGVNVPSKFVAVLASGGPAPQAFQSSAVELRFASVQCLCRGEPRDQPGALALARSVRNALHHVAIAGYVNIECEQSEPLHAGEDEQGHHLYSVNVSLWHEQ